MLGLLEQGLRNKESVRPLFITDRTMNVHMLTTCQGLDVAKRCEEVSVALDVPMPSAGNAE